jgi:hypothetical protein
MNERSCGRSLTVALFCVSFALGCSDDPPGEPEECDDRCRHDSALLGLRQTLKLVYNITLQGKPVGAQDHVTPCPFGGGARIYGTATSNPVHGATEVDLTYELLQCRYIQRDDEAPENYDLTVTGVVRQTGIIAVQPSASTALIISSESITLQGEVHDPPLSYSESDCTAQLAQSGNLLSGHLCNREVGVDL